MENKILKVADFTRVYEYLKQQRTGHEYEDMNNPDTYAHHATLCGEIANTLLFAQGKSFIIDDDNRNILRFLLLYFNKCPNILELIPDCNHTINKQLILSGRPGIGKTFIMEIFSEYLRATNNPNYFKNLSISQILDYYKRNNHLDLYTYNETGNRPMHICINDIGLATYKHFGQDVKIIIDEMLYSRYDLYSRYNIYTHMTTNVSNEELMRTFDDRLVDRFKSYNIINMLGESKR